jgi:hypothetical protein
MNDRSIYSLTGNRALSKSGKIDYPIFSAALSLALRARGFASTSAGEGRRGFLVIIFSAAW